MKNLPLLIGKNSDPRRYQPEIGDLLKRTEQSQSVLEQAPEAFHSSDFKDDEDSAERNDFGEPFDSR